MENITNGFGKGYPIDVVPLTAVDQAYTYLCPYSESNPIGKRVLIDLVGRKITGIVVNINDNIHSERELKPIIRVLDTEAIISLSLLNLCLWISSYYVTPLGSVLKAILPPKLITKESNYVRIRNVPDFSEFILPANQRKVLEFLQSYNKPLSLTFLKRSLKIKNLKSVLKNLSDKGLIDFTSGVKSPLEKLKLVLNPRAFEEDNYQVSLDLIRKRKSLVRILEYLYNCYVSGETFVTIDQIRKTSSHQNLKKNIKFLEESGIVSVEKYQDYELNSQISGKFSEKKELLLEPTAEQSQAIEKIVKSISDGLFFSYLLYGITGSGKTLVYFHAIKKCLELNKSAIVLVPEISLTPQMISRFENAFPNEVAVLHSKLTDTERASFWYSILKGKKRIVIGARSAVFAPTSNLGLIVVDEENEPSYKQEAPEPRYNARDVALMRGKFENAVVVLGSATPSVTSFYLSLKGKHRLLKLNNRVDGATLPKVEIIDIAESRRRGEMFGSFSATLLHKIIEKYQRREKVIIFQNRRGFALNVLCRECGNILKCPNCEVSLTYHKFDNSLKCHYCGYLEIFSGYCKVCGSVNIEKYGYGTQRIEEELQEKLEIFGISPKIQRFDLDSVKNLSQIETALKNFFFGDTDILVGTQIIAKGLDFEKITLVGIVNADLQIYLPDFSATERAFQLFTQVAGRSGRSTDYPGEVVVQTFNPDSYVVQAFAKNDFSGFYNNEILFRKEIRYPPFSRLIALEVQGKDFNICVATQTLIHTLIKQTERIALLGPTIPVIPKIRGNYRYVSLLKVDRSFDPSGSKVSAMLKTIRKEVEKNFGKKIKFIIDVDCIFALM